jgi:hypothetical protein
MKPAKRFPMFFSPPSMLLFHKPAAGYYVMAGFLDNGG